jgi:hypothetical protein
MQVSSIYLLAPDIKEKQFNLPIDQMRFIERRKPKPMKVFNIYDYIFYKIFMLNKFIDHLFNKDESPQWRSIILLSFLLSLNFITVISIMYVFYSTQFLEELTTISPFKMTLFFIVIIFINYLYFIKNEKYLAIKKRYENESNNSKIIGRIFVLFYVFSTISSVIIFGILASNHQPIA